MTLKAPLVEEEKKKQIKNSPNHYEVFSRNYVEKLVCDFVNKNQIVAHYGKDDDGIFEVRFKVKEVSDEQRETITINYNHWFSCWTMATIPGTQTKKT